MESVQEKWIAVDYFNESILLVRDTENGLHRAIIDYLDEPQVVTQGAIRIYRIDTPTYFDIVDEMERTGLPLYKIAKPRRQLS